MSDPLAELSKAFKDESINRTAEFLSFGLDEEADPVSGAFLADHITNLAESFSTG